MEQVYSAVRRDAGVSVLMTLMLAVLWALGTGTCAASQPWAQHPSSPTSPAFLRKETGLSEQEGS